MGFPLASACCDATFFSIVLPMNYSRVNVGLFPTANYHAPLLLGSATQIYFGACYGGVPQAQTVGW